MLRVTGCSGVCAIADPQCELPAQAVFSLSGVFFSVDRHLYIKQPTHFCFPIRPFVPGFSRHWPYGSLRAVLVSRQFCLCYIRPPSRTSVFPLCYQVFSIATYTIPRPLVTLSKMLHPFQSQSSYMQALHPFVHRTMIIAASKRNLSITACKHESGGVQLKMVEDKQNSNEHQPRIEPKLGDRPPSGLNKELNRLDDWWLKYSKEQERKKTAEIQNLSVGSSLIITITFLIFL